MSINGTLATIRSNIENSIINNKMTRNTVTIMAASKSQTVSVIEEAIAAGITDFGENRVQEAQDKWPPLKERFPRIRLHLIGPLQTNKVKQALELFDVIQTIDRPKLADAIAAYHSSRIAHRFFIQVNIGKEPQKAGVMPEDTDALIAHCKTALHLPIAGLMCIPPHDQPAAPHFAMLRQMAIRHDLKELSMGMSDDYETAVRMGSTCVRLGRALFGERTTS